MKKIFTLLAFSTLLGSVSFAQSQRFQIVEEFTGENCGPCAGTNPFFDAIWNAPSNHSKMTTIKYQGNIPSAGPVLYNQNTTDVTARMSYYTVSSHPSAMQDGELFNPGSQYEGHPAEFEQSHIDARVSVTSPFSYSVSHSFVGPNKDSVRVQAVFTCTQAVTYNANKLKNHIVLVEKEIKFETAPGTNGETEFFNVVRKMFYGPAGKVVQSSWIVGDAITIDTTFSLPYKSTVANKYVYDKSKLAIVCFLQYDTNKEIQQGAISEEQKVDLDAEIVSLSSGATGTECATSASGLVISPTCVLKNNGLTTMTSVDISVFLGTTFVSSLTWNGSLVTDAVETVVLSSLTIPSGTSKVVVKTGSVNGMADENIGYKGTYSVGYFNGEKSKKIAVLPFTTSALPITQDFEGATFPPTAWTLDNVDGDAATWSRKTSVVGCAAGNDALKMDYYNSPEASYDNIYLPKFDLPATGNFGLRFKYSHKAYPFTSGQTEDTLRIKISSDCGATWTTLDDQNSSSGLQTVDAGSATTAYTTAATSEWKQKTVSLGTSFAGMSGLFIKLEAASGYGNNLYIDDIYLGEFSSNPSITNVTACKDDADVTLTATGTSLKWYTDEAVCSTGSATTPTPSTASAGTTTYYVTQTEAGKAESEKTAITVTVSTCLSVAENTSNSAFVVSPNPVSESAQITFVSDNTTNAKVSLIGILGNVVYAKNIEKTQTGVNTIDLNTTEVSNGIYFVNLEMNGKVQTQKIVVNK